MPKTTKLILAGSLLVTIVSLVFWGKAQTIISPGASSPALASDADLWAITDPLSYDAEMAKYKSPEQVAREQQAIADFADPIRYTARVLESDAEYAKAYDWAS